MKLILLLYLLMISNVWYYQDIMQVPYLYLRDGNLRENMPNMDDVVGTSDIVQQVTIGGDHADADDMDVPDDIYFLIPNPEDDDQDDPGMPDGAPIHRKRT
ncbi:hypothetical protein ACOSQ3_007266 [Xanthoceras sorbifolium]